MKYKTKSAHFKQVLLGLVLFFVAALMIGCQASVASSNRYFGKTVLPREQVLRYVSGAEPESLDPQMSDGQPEARIYLALYEGLVEYDPKDMHPIPAVATSWETNPNATEFIFHLRNNARWSDGKPITASDFVYSLRRGFAPETLSRTASYGYYIKYAEAFNSKSVFVKKSGEFLLAKDFAETGAESAAHQSEPKEIESFGAETEFYKFISAPERLVLNGDEKKRLKQIAANPKLQAATEGAEFVPVVASDIGVEAIDDRTLRIVLRQPAPFFLGLLAHQFFRLVPEQAVEKYGNQWTRPENIVTCGAFKVKEHRPYDVLTVERDPNYWDADTVKLDEIKFYAVEEQSTTLNLYKAGELDAFQNHFVPKAWVDEILQYKDEYLNFPEASITYYSINVKKPPMDDLKVRQAFNLAIDKEALSKWRKITKPLYDFTPSGIFPEYEAARARTNEQMREERNISAEEWSKRHKYDPEKARKLLTEAGFPVSANDNGFSCPSFPVDQVSITYNTTESNRQIAEFIQANWKQNLGITVALKNMEFKTFLPLRSAVQYDGFVISNYNGDYMDPFTFLGLHYGEANLGATGWQDDKYDQMIDESNQIPDAEKRYEMMARAENYLLDQQIMIPLYTNATNWMKKPYVKGLYPNPGTLHAWKYVYLEPDQAKWDANVFDIMK